MLFLFLNKFSMRVVILKKFYQINEKLKIKLENI